MLYVNYCINKLNNKLPYVVELDGSKIILLTWNGPGDEETTVVTELILILDWTHYLLEEA